MAVTKKSIKLGEKKVYDTNLIYSRVIGLQANSRDVNIKEVPSCELSPVPLHSLLNQEICESLNQSQS